MTRAELLTAAKQILFNTEMVQAILEGRKSVTRRKIDAKSVEAVLSSPARIENPELSDQQFIERLCTAPCEAGDILWVRETFSPVGVQPIRYLYKCFCPEAEGLPVRWRPSIHMPKEAARIFLKVTDVRVERLQEITPEQVDAEGFKEYGYSATTGELMPSTPIWFSIAWDSTIKPAKLPLYGWDANPWVWAIEFERMTADE